MFTAVQVEEHTRKWIMDVVVGCNFCPFAANVMKQQTVHYRVETSGEPAICLEALLAEVTRMNNDAAIDTIFLILPDSFADFEDYLDLVSVAEDLLIDEGYEGIYQLASFHPLYRFEGTTDGDAANYTNRSVYPMLHLLRESSIDKALEYYKDPEAIPGTNINFAREKGLVYMKMLRDACTGS